jgi:hypothetical protein
MYADGARRLTRRIRSRRGPTRFGRPRNFEHFFARLLEDRSGDLDVSAFEPTAQIVGQRESDSRPGNAGDLP